jgi:hypothetical protein
MIPLEFHSGLGFGGPFPPGNPCYKAFMLLREGSLSLYTYLQYMDFITPQLLSSTPTSVSHA